MSPPHPGQSRGNSSPTPAMSFADAFARRVVRAWLVTRIRVAASFRGIAVVSMPASRGLAPLADVADRECRNGFSQPVIRREHSVIPARRPANESGACRGGSRSGRCRRCAPNTVAPAQANSNSDRTLASSLCESASVSVCKGTTAVFWSTILTTRPFFSARLRRASILARS